MGIPGLLRGNAGGRRFVIAPAPPSERRPDGTRADHLGRRKLGGDLVVDLGYPSHCIVTGQTRSGKTASAYNVLSQIACHREVAVAGVDPTGVLLGPWGSITPTFSGGFILLAHRSKHVRALRVVAAEMDRRISTYLGLEQHGWTNSTRRTSQQSYR